MHNFTFHSSFLSFSNLRTILKTDSGIVSELSNGRTPSLSALLISSCSGRNPSISKSARESLINCSSSTPLTRFPRTRIFLIPISLPSFLILSAATLLLAPGLTTTISASTDDEEPAIPDGEITKKRAALQRRTAPRRINNTSLGIKFRKLL